jgi:PKD repeat protein
MTLKRFTAEGGTTGSVVTTANSASGSGDALTTAAYAASGTAVYSITQKMHGSKAILVTCAAAADTAIFGYGGLTASTLPGEVYIYITALPTLGSATVAQVRAGGPSANLVVTTAAKLAVIDAAGATIKTFATSLAVNTWYRLYIRGVPGTTITNGTIEAAYYVGDSTTPAETMYTGTAVNCGVGGAGTATDFRWGKTATVGDITAYFDDAAENDGGTGPIGPANALAVTLSVSPTSAAAGSTFAFTAAATGGSTSSYSYAFDYGDGITLAAQSSSTVNHTYTTAGNYTATVTAQNV